MFVNSHIDGCPMFNRDTKAATATIIVAKTPIGHEPPPNVARSHRVDSRSGLALCNKVLNESAASAPRPSRTFRPSSGERSRMIKPRRSSSASHRSPVVDEMPVPRMTSAPLSWSPRSLATKSLRSMSQAGSLKRLRPSSLSRFRRRARIVSASSASADTVHHLALFIDAPELRLRRR